MDEISGSGSVSGSLFGYWLPLPTIRYQALHAYVRSMYVCMHVCVYVCIYRLPQTLIGAKAGRHHSSNEGVLCTRAELDIAMRSQAAVPQRFGSASFCLGLQRKTCARQLFLVRPAQGKICYKPSCENMFVSNT